MARSSGQGVEGKDGAQEDKVEVSAGYGRVLGGASIKFIGGLTASEMQGSLLVTLCIACGP